MNFFSKICSICGFEKPLNFFPQHANPEGVSYADVCSTCGDTQSLLKKMASDARGTGAGSGFKIDAKAKIKYESDKKKKKLIKTAKEELQKKKLQEKTDKLKKKKIDIAKKQLRHRQELIESSDEEIIPIQTKKHPKKKSAIKQGALTKNQEKQDALEKDYANAQIDLTNVYIDPNITGQLKYQSAEFLKFKTLMLAGAFIGTIERQMGKIHGGELATLENIQDKTNTTKPTHAPENTPHLSPDAPTLFAKPTSKKPANKKFNNLEKKKKTV